LLADTASILSQVCGGNPRSLHAGDCRERGVLDASKTGSHRCFSASLATWRTSTHHPEFPDREEARIRHDATSQERDRPLQSTHSVQMPCSVTGNISCRGANPKSVGMARRWGRRMCLHWHSARPTQGGRNSAGDGGDAWHQGNRTCWWFKTCIRSSQTVD